MSGLKQQIEKKAFGSLDISKSIRVNRKVVYLKDVLGLLADYNVFPKGKESVSWKQLEEAIIKKQFDVYKGTHTVAIVKLHHVLNLIDAFKKQTVCKTRKQFSDAFDNGIAELEDQKYNIMPPDVPVDYVISEEDTRTLLKNIQNSLRNQNDSD